MYVCVYFSFVFVFLPVKTFKKSWGSKCSFLVGLVWFDCLQAILKSWSPCFTTYVLTNSYLSTLLFSCTASYRMSLSKWYSQIWRMILFFVFVLEKRLCDRSLLMLVAFGSLVEVLKNCQCIHILSWGICVGLGHSDPLVELHMWPLQQVAQRSSRGHWHDLVFVQVFLNKCWLCPHSLIWSVSFLPHHPRYFTR